MPIRILFVDDEAGIRATLPVILQQNGYEVVAAATVAEAIQRLGEQRFDILIADLNIGEPGDGFTVVSAMRRTQPLCRTIILTGYPDFESALVAIRNQVDDYIMKPADIRSLLESLQRSLESGERHRGVERKSISDILEEQSGLVIADSLAAMQAHPEVGKLPLTDGQRMDHLPALLVALAKELRSAAADQGPSERSLQIAAEHGRTRYEQSYSVRNLLDDRNIVYKAICDTVQANLLALDLSNLVADLKRISEGLDARLQESVDAYLEAQRRRAA